jgi:hypothetical protein
MKRKHVDLIMAILLTISGFLWIWAVMYSLPPNKISLVILLYGWFTACFGAVMHWDSYRKSKQ